MTGLYALEVGSALSYVMAVLVPALDALVPVLPSETVVIALGVATAGGADPRIGLLVAVAAFGAFLGDNAAYLVGRRFGPTVDRRLHPGRAHRGHPHLRPDQLPPAQVRRRDRLRQLFAVGYAACFESALGVVGRRERAEVGDVLIDSRVSLLPTGERGFKLAVELDVALPQVQDPEQAARIVAGAHQVCPYSNATRGNIDVTLTVNGRDIAGTALR